MDDIFCKIIRRELPANVVYETDELISIMDAMPFNPGHVLIIPKKHYTTILDMDEDIIKEIHKCAKMLMNKMIERYEDLESIKVIVNYGEEQKVKHYHMHLLPFYKANKKPKITQEEFCEILKR